MRVHPLLKALTVVASLAALGFGALLAYEALLLGPFATPERIAAYHFSSEAMVGHGGIAYESRTSYVALSAVPALLLLFSAGLGGIGSIRGKTNFCIVSLLCTAIGLAFPMWGGG